MTLDEFLRSLTQQERPQIMGPAVETAGFGSFTTTPQAPQPAEQTQAATAGATDVVPSRSFGRRLYDFGHALSGGDVPDYDAQRLAQNQTYQWLLKNKSSPEEALAAIANPELLQ